MKAVFFALLFFTAFSMAGQNNEGRIIYEDKYNIHKNLPPRMEAMKDRIPEFRSSKKELIFKVDEALYKAYVETTEKPQEFKGEGRRYRWGSRGENNEYYTNVSSMSSVDRREFFGKEFLIEGERDKLPWKITTEQKQVGSYLCQKAILQDSTSTTIAWFTPMIPVAAGPDDFYGLPGMILHVDVDEGTRFITAQSIELKVLDQEIERPSKGKKVTKEEFEKIREEKMKEIEQEYGGNRRYRYMRR